MVAIEDYKNGLLQTMFICNGKTFVKNLYEIFYKLKTIIFYLTKAQFLINNTYCTSYFIKYFTNFLFPLFLLTKIVS